MSAARLGDDGQPTRIFCKSCYACVAIDHAVSYANNVYMFQPDHCRPNFDVTVAPTLTRGQTIRYIIARLAPAEV